MAAKAEQSDKSPWGRRWLPPPVVPAMFPGIMSEIVAATETVTEAHPAAIAAEVLVGLGNASGRQVHTRVGAMRHGVNLNALIVGKTSTGGKGDARAVADAPLTEAAPEWRKYCVKNGLSSGEGLLFHVRDAVTQHKNGKQGATEQVVDRGVGDKRLCVWESEFGRVLKNCRRESNVLSDVLRDAWDGKSPLCTLTKHNATVATDAHISVAAHCTPADLHTYLGDLDAAMGLPIDSCSWRSIGCGRFQTRVRSAMPCGSVSVPACVRCWHMRMACVK